MLKNWFLKQRRTSGILLNFLMDNTRHCKAKKALNGRVAYQCFLSYIDTFIKCAGRGRIKKSGRKSSNVIDVLNIRMIRLYKLLFILIIY